VIKLSKKITIKFVGEARNVVGFETLEIELEADNLTVSQLLKMLSEKYRNNLNKLLEHVRENRYVILLDGVNVSYLNGLETIITNMSTMTIVHAAVGG